MERIPLQTTFGRRMLAVLFLCLLAPILLLVFVSFRQVEARFREDTLRGMRFQTRQVAMAINSGLNFLDQGAEFFGPVIESGTSPQARDWLSKNRSILAVSRIRRGSAPEPLYGSACPPPPAGRQALSHLAAGKGLLYLERGPEGTFRAFIARALPGIPPEREILSFEVNLEFLWERVRDELPPVSEAFVLSPDGDVLYRTWTAPPEIVERVRRESGDAHLGEFAFDDTDEPQLVFHAMVFLKPSFHSGHWTVGIVHPRSLAFAATNRFMRVLLLAVGLVVLASGLFAIVRLRRSVAPLARLKAGTLRVRDGDFDSRIEIESGDEFEELARSFNSMAERLGREFRTQAGMGRTIQAILGETHQGRIVRALLDNVRSVVPCDQAGVALLESPGKPGAAVTCTRDGAAADPSGTGRALMFLGPKEIDRLAALKASVAADPDGEFGEFLSRWPGPRPGTFLLAPLTWNGAPGGVLLLGLEAPPSSAPEILVRLRQVADQAAIALSRARLVEEMNEADLGTLQALSRAVDTNSHWTAGHSQRVTDLAMEIAWELGLPRKEIDLIRRGGLLHDIGKLGIPGTILDKPGKLTKEEFDLIRKHPDAGAGILRPIPALQKIIPLVAQHHERFDGSGYPLGLAGEAISQHARILALADVVDAMTSNRPYRAGLPREEVLAHVTQRSGAEFDPAVVEAFRKIAAARHGDPLTGAPWSTAPIPRAAAPEALFSGYSEPLLHG